MRSSNRMAALASVGILGLTAALSACGPDSPGDRGINAPPVIDEVTSATKILKPKASTVLAVTAHDPDGDADPAATGGADVMMAADAGSASGAAPGLTVTWEVDDPTWTVSGDGAEATLTAPDAYASKVTVTVTVTDADDASETARLSVETGTNEVPTIAGLAANPNPVKAGGQVSLKADASDPNDDTLSYSWSGPEGWTFDGTEGSETTVTAPNEQQASADLSVTVTDGYGGEATERIRVETLSNSPPVISSLVADPPQVAPSGQIDLRATASDPEGGELTYAWSVPGNWKAGSTDGKAITITAPDAYEASATVKVTVTDDSGASVEGEILVSTRSNNGPIISAVDANPKAVLKGGTIDLEVSASDPDGDMLSYAWSVTPMDWTLTENGAKATLTAPDTPGATASITVKVTDEDGKEALATIVVSTQPNRAPTVSSVSANPQTLKPGGTATLTASADDADGDSLNYEWNAPKDWTVSGGMGGTATLTAPNTYDTTGVINVKVTDNFGGSATGTVVVSTAANGAPIIASLTANPPTVAPGGIIDVEVNAADPNGDSLNYNWNIPAGWSKASTGGTSKPNVLSLKAPQNFGAKDLVNVSVDDGNGGASTGSVFVSTADNGPPVVSSVTANPPETAPKGTITVEASASDPNGDSLSFNWTVPSGWTKSGSGNKITVTAPDKFGERGLVKVTADDGNGAQAGGSVFVSTADNQTPSISALTASPQTVKPKGTSTIEATASDPDGATLTYTWNVPNGWTMSGSGDKITVTAPDQFGAQGTVTLTVDDGDGATATSSVVLNTAGNAAPVVSSVTANPQPAKPGAKVTVDAIASDADGDALTYKWTVPNGWTKSGSGASITLTAPSGYGQSGVVRVTVEDGNGGSTKGSTLLSTEQNQAPVLSALTANPQQVAPGGSVTVQATAADPNGDSLNYNWQVPNGWSKTGSGNSITLTAPGSYGQSGLVSVTITDGNGGSTNGSVLVSTDRNQSPIISSVTANPVLVAAGGTSTVTAVASDPNGDSLSYAWTLPNGWSKTGSGAQISVTAPNQSGVSGTIKVTVSDGKGGSSQSAVVIQTSTNSPPTIKSLTATPQTVAPGGTSTVKVTASDPEGANLSYTWKLPNGWTGSSNTDTIQVTAPNQYSVTGVVEVVVSDGASKVSKKVAISTSANQPPTISKVAASPNPVLQNGETTVTATASDPGGDPLTYSWSIDNNGWTIKSNSNNKMVLSAPNNGNSSVKVTVTVRDGHGGKATSTVTVQTSACSSGTANCDGDVNNGCEVDLNSDGNNCGSCGNTCGGNTPHCSSGQCIALYTFSGIKNNVQVSSLSGWSRCYLDTYDNRNRPSISSILSQCNKANILMACRQKGSNTLRVAAHAPRGDVTYNLGEQNATHTANGVGWYYGDDESWGFAPVGQSVSRSSCDTDNGGSNDRICWHTFSGDLGYGWRCGDRTSLNSASGWERVLYHAN